MIKMKTTSEEHTEFLNQDVGIQMSKIEAQSQIELWETVRTLLAVKTYTNVYTR